MTHMSELEHQECIALLTSDEVGRVALATPDGPRILPVNYRVHDDHVYFRTMPYSVLGTYGHEVELAFEIDHLDHGTRQGWSVVVLGRGSWVEDPDEVRRIRAGWDPSPWAGSHRYMYLKLHIREATGRRIVKAPVIAAPTGG